MKVLVALFQEIFIKTTKKNKAQNFIKINKKKKKPIFSKHQKAK
jgi:hypothetical protein